MHYENCIYPCILSLYTVCLFSLPLSYLRGSLLCEALTVNTNASLHGPTMCVGVCVCVCVYIYIKYGILPFITSRVPVI